MSVLCDVTLWVNDSGGSNGSKRREQLDAWLEQPMASDTERGQGLRRIGGDMSEAGGTKFYTNSVYAACFNHVITSEVLEHLDILAKDPLGKWMRMVAIIEHEHEDQPIVWTNTSVMLVPIEDSTSEVIPGVVVVDRPQIGGRS